MPQSCLFNGESPLRCPDAEGGGRGEGIHHFGVVRWEYLTGPMVQLPSYGGVIAPLTVEEILRIMINTIFTKQDIAIQRPIQNVRGESGVRNNGVTQEGAVARGQG